jgi:hypothetical protein
MVKACTFAMCTVVCISTAHGFVFFDGDWNAAEWSYRQVSPAGTIQVSFLDSGGNPGAMVALQQHNGPLGQGAWLSLWRPDFGYDPSAQGALSVLHVAEDDYSTRVNILTQPSSNAFMIIQGGVEFYSPFHTTFSETQIPVWQTHAFDYSAISFTSVAGTHPDFGSSGGAMIFGLHSRSFSGTPVTGGCKVDNFTVSATPVPEPLSAAVFASGLGLLYVRRRK